MKKLIIQIVLLSCIATVLFAQVKVPSAIVESFKQKFPDATSIKWEKEDVHEYEATFQSKGVKQSVMYSDKGELLETETAIKFNQLPDKVQKAYNAKYVQLKPKSLAKIETERGVITFEIKMNQAGKTIEVFYSPEGIEIPVQR